MFIVVIVSWNNLTENKIHSQVRSTEQLLSEIAKMQGPPQELEIKDGAVFTHKFLHRGSKYGPYTVKYTDQPVDRQFAWEVSSMLFFYCSFFIFAKKNVPFPIPTLTHH